MKDFIWEKKKLETAGDVMEAAIKIHNKDKAMMFLLDYVRSGTDITTVKSNLRFGLSRFYNNDNYEDFYKLFNLDEWDYNLYAKGAS